MKPDCQGACCSNVLCGTWLSCWLNDMKCAPKHINLSLWRVIVGITLNRIQNQCSPFNRCRKLWTWSQKKTLKRHLHLAFSTAFFKHYPSLIPNLLLWSVVWVKLRLEYLAVTVSFFPIFTAIACITLTAPSAGVWGKNWEQLSPALILLSRYPNLVTTGQLQLTANCKKRWKKIVD